MKIARELLDQIIDHARRDAPDECCGLIGGRDGRATSVHPQINSVRSPLRFEMPGMDVFRTTEEIEDRGDELLSVYHSHTRSAPYPSQTDINFSVGWPGIEWLIVGLAGDEPEIRSYVIADGQVQEVDVEVE
ncbi:MAG TPA: M67 family metallopeptidase [Solirubrobacteraceae bacterium]|nr:M67 family metallopeptidase [Solirubrobacteraceae bacterium]